MNRIHREVLGEGTTPSTSKTIGSQSSGFFSSSPKTPSTDTCSLGSSSSSILGESFSIQVTSSDKANGRFRILHFAGEVVYSTKGFVDKNTDRVPNMVRDVLRSSSRRLLPSVVKKSIQRENLQEPMSEVDYPRVSLAI